MFSTLFDKKRQTVQTLSPDALFQPPYALSFSVVTISDVFFECLVVIDEHLKEPIQEIRSQTEVCEVDQISHNPTNTKTIANGSLWEGVQHCQQVHSELMRGSQRYLLPNVDRPATPAQARDGIEMSRQVGPARQ